MKDRCPRCGFVNDADEVQCEQCGEILRPAKDGLRHASLRRVLFTQVCPPTPCRAYTLDSPEPGRWRPTRGLLCRWLLVMVVLAVSGAALAAFGPLSVEHGPALFLAGLWALAGAGAVVLGGAGVWLAMLLAHWIEEMLPARTPDADEGVEPDAAPAAGLRHRKILAPRAAPPATPGTVTSLPHVSPPVSPAGSGPVSVPMSPSPAHAAAAASPQAWWPQPRTHSLALTIAASVVILIAVYLAAVAFAPLEGGQALVALVPVAVCAAVILVLAHINGNHRGVAAAALVVSLAGLFIAAANLWLLNALAEAARREADRSNARIEERIKETAEAIKKELTPPKATPTPTIEPSPGNRAPVFGPPSAAEAQLRVETLTDRPNSSGWIGHVYIDTDGKPGAEKAIKILNTRNWQLLESSGRPGLYDRHIASGLMDKDGDFRGLPGNTFDGSREVWVAGSIRATRNGVPVPAHH
jgi:hypothetical protein